VAVRTDRAGSNGDGIARPGRAVAVKATRPWVVPTTAWSVQGDGRPIPTFVGTSLIGWYALCDHFINTSCMHSLSDYMILTLKMFKSIYCKRYDHKTINEFKYILTPQIVVAAYNVTV
jgi:hypothetical protein